MTFHRIWSTKLNKDHKKNVLLGSKDPWIRVFDPEFKIKIFILKIAAQFKDLNLNKDHACI